MPKIKTYTRHQVMLDKTSLTVADALGNGNISLGFRKLAELHMKSMENMKESNKFNRECKDWDIDRASSQ